MVDEGAIREALLTAQEKLVVAYGAGPAALDDYFLDFEALKKQIIDASRLDLLSSDTMQLAAIVVGGIPAICQSFMALDEAAADAVAKVKKKIQNLHLDYQDDEDEFGEDGSDSDVSTDSDASSERAADETDKDDESDDSDMDYGRIGADADEDSDSDEEPDPPKWDLLRDWLLDNIAYPFARHESEHERMLRLANISYPSFLHWLKQMRDNIQWDEFLQQHSKGDPRQFKRILITAQGDPSSISPATLAAVLQMKTLICETYEDTTPQWWDDVIGLVEGMENMFWEGAVEEVHRGSCEIYASDEDDGDEGDQVHIKAEITPHPIAMAQDAVIPVASSLLGVKRKALDMSTYELPGLHESLQFYVSHDTELPVAKRMKQEDDTVALLHSCRNSSPTYCEVSFSGSGSSRATTYSPAPEALTSSSSPSLTSGSPVKQEANDPSLFLLSSLSSSLTANLFKPIRQHPLSTSPTHEKAEVIEKLNVEVPITPYRPDPQAQIPTGTEAMPPYTRSSTIPFDRKRKRKAETKNYNSSQFEPDASPIPTTQLVTATNIPVTRIDSQPSSICSEPNQPSINNTTPDSPPPFKRFRPNGSESPSIIPDGRSYVYTPLPSNKYKSKRKVDKGKALSATSHSRPPATDRTQLVATSPCETQSGDRDDIGQLLRILEEINVTIPGSLPLETNPPLFSLASESPQTFDSSNWTMPAYLDPTTEASESYYQLLGAPTPSLSAASPNGESPYSYAEVATPTTTADFAQDFSTTSEFYNIDLAPSGFSAQIFDDLSANSSYLNIAGEQGNLASES